MTTNQSNGQDPERTETFSDWINLSTDPHAERPSPDTMLGKIGPYHLRRVIASGGMGIVYEAVQEHPRRVVALKVMKHGVASKSALRRFEYESQILARLRHPGIAQVYEAGTHDDGSGAVPFFAMEYVPNAKPITAYADTKRLDTRRRLELFAQVCDAVHHGHQKGIIHRDLKPGNILVDSDGSVKIIDFGVARGTDSDMAVTTLQTDVGQLIGTMQYMSPEQVEGDPHDLDIRSDVHGLGVVLYELLCGKLPYEVSGRSVVEAARLIREQQPARLSGVDASLKGDVETIVSKAIQKDRDRRYQSALELGQDIRRYLADEGIIAREPSILYQFRMFTRRNKALLGALGAVFVVILVGAGVSTWQAIRARREAAIATAVNDFLNNDVLAAIAPEKLGLHTPREALDVISKKIKGKFTDQPLVEASIRFTLANAYWNIGEYKAGVPHAETAFKLQRSGLGEDHPTTLGSMDMLAMLYKYRGRFDEAEPLYVKTLQTRRRVLGDEHPDTLESMNNLAVLLWQRGKLDEAEELHRHSLDVHRRVLGAENLDTLTSMVNLAAVLWDKGKLGKKGKLDEAEALQREVLGIHLRVLGEDHRDTVQSMNNLAMVLRLLGRVVEAEALYRKALEIGRGVFGHEHPRVASILNNLGALLVEKGDYGPAETMLREALAMRHKLLGEGQREIGDTRSHLGQCFRRQGRYREAEQELLAGHRVLATALGESHSKTREAAERLGGLYEAWGKREKAAAWRARIKPADSSAKDSSQER